MELSLKHASPVRVKPSAKHESGGSLDRIPLNDTLPPGLPHALMNIKALAAHTE